MIPDQPPAWAVITPESELTWYLLDQERNVRAMVGGKVAPGALDTATVAGPLKVLASDIALLFPEDYPPNPLAERVLTVLSGGRITQPWRGHVALVEYEIDGETREVLWPGVMSEQWQQRIREAAGGHG